MYSPHTLGGGSIAYESVRMVPGEGDRVYFFIPENPKNRYVNKVSIVLSVQVIT